MLTILQIVGNVLIVGWMSLQGGDKKTPHNIGLVHFMLPLSTAIFSETVEVHIICVKHTTFSTHAMYSVIFPLSRRLTSVTYMIAHLRSFVFYSVQFCMFLYVSQGWYWNYMQTILSSFWFMLYWCCILLCAAKPILLLPLQINNCCIVRRSFCT